MRSMLRRRGLAPSVLAVVIGVCALALGPGGATAGAVPSPPTGATTTPIKHLVVIFQENVSFDHYFGTYPDATNTDGQRFLKLPFTGPVNGLTQQLQQNNPNGTNPRRYDPANVNDVITCDQDHNYTDEQRAFDNGAMDKFPATVGNGTSKTPEGGTCVAGDVMNYYDGNTVTALWNYAQRFAMSDNSFGTTFGPSAPGAVNLVSGDTGGVDTAHMAHNPSVGADADLVPDGNGGFSLTGDAQPYWDDCSTRDAVALTGKNIGDELNAAGVSWGWFQGGFRPSTSYTDALAATGHSGQATSTFVPDEFSGQFNQAPAANQGICNTVHAIGPAENGTGQFGFKDDYIPHHEPFEYYASTSNPHHLTIPTGTDGQDTPAGLASIGTDTQHSSPTGAPQFDTPNHQYDMSDFDQLVSAVDRHALPNSALPAVSFLKAPGIDDGHAQYSDPLDEQHFLATEINALMRTPDWAHTAVVISYDDSDGWYDHVYSGVHNPSHSVADALTGTGQCGSGTPLAGEQARCGYGPRLPLVVISPWAKFDYVDHTLTDQSSITRFIEDNWGVPRIPGSYDSIAGSLNNMFDFRGFFGFPLNGLPLFINPTTGEPSLF